MEDRQAFSAAAASVGPLVAVLRTFLIEPETQTVLLTASPAGLTLTSEVGRALFISATLPAAHFAQWKLAEQPVGGPDGEDRQDVSFALNLRVFLDCLSIFGHPAAVPQGAGGHHHQGHGAGGHGKLSLLHTAASILDSSNLNGTSASAALFANQPGTIDYLLANSGSGNLSGNSTSIIACKLEYDQERSELDLILEDTRDDIVTACHLATVEHRQFVNLINDFADYPVVAKVLVQSDCLLDIFESIDSTVEHIRLSFYNSVKVAQATQSYTQTPSERLESPHNEANQFSNVLRISARGVAGEFEAEILGSSDVIQEFFLDLDTYNAERKQLADNVPADFIPNRARQEREVGVDQGTRTEDEDILSNILTFKYDIKLIAPLLKPLSRSHKTSIRVNSRGVFSIKFLMRIAQSEQTFVEFVLSPSLEL